LPTETTGHHSGRPSGDTTHRKRKHPPEYYQIRWITSPPRLVVKKPKVEVIEISSESESESDSKDTISCDNVETLICQEVIDWDDYIPKSWPSWEDIEEMMNWK
jgi:hypothetical protein